MKLQTSYAHPSDGGHYVTIPVLGVVVGSIERDKVMQYMSNNRKLILRNLSTDLSAANYDELKKLDGEQYLMGIIAESLNKTMGATRGSYYIQLTGEYKGIRLVLLPSSFSVH